MEILKSKKTRAFISILACTLMLLQATALVSPSQALVTITSDALDVEADVGAIHFNGEIADFYVMVSLAGVPTDAMLNASLYFDGALYANLTSLVQQVDTGLYRIPYTIPCEASPGTYALVVNAYSETGVGVALKSFLISQTLTGWNTWITEIRNNVACIKTDVGTIQVSLENINTTVTNIDENIMTIETNIGEIQVNLNEINSVMIELNGTVVTIQTDIGIVKTNVSNIQLNITNIQGNTTEITTVLGDLEGSILTINEGMLSINTSIGVVQTSISSLNAAITEIQGDIATIKTDIGTIKVTLDEMNTPAEGAGLDATSVGIILAVVIIIAIVTVGVLVLRKRGKAAT